MPHTLMPPLHLITCEYPPRIGGVSEHSRVVAEAAAAAGYEVHVWTGSDAPPAGRVVVHADLEDFSSAALTRADAALNAWPAPRQVILQWVPHGYGRRGLNVPFSRWVRRRSQAGDRIDLIVHEPFMDFLGSWHQPALSLVQRYMTWTVVRAADRVWLTIPGWESRVRRAMRRDQPAPRTLPVPATIPPVRDAPAVAAFRRTLLNGRSHLVGYFGAGGSYPLHAIATTVRQLSTRHADVAFVCIGRGSEAFAADVRAALGSGHLPITGTGALERGRVSLHLQACDALLQPYPDGVSGRRTTTVSALEHGVPVVTTIGELSEPFWKQSQAVELVPALSPAIFPDALMRLLVPLRRAAGRDAALTLYREYFDPARTLEPLLAPRDLRTCADGRGRPLCDPGRCDVRSGC
jgi:glycosyltransferase involved in cell wall biosynthesis